MAILNFLFRWLRVETEPGTGAGQEKHRMDWVEFMMSFLLGGLTDCHHLFHWRRARVSAPSYSQYDENIMYNILQVDEWMEWNWTVGLTAEAWREAEEPSSSLPGEGNGGGQM